MFKFVVLAALLAMANASGYAHAPIAVAAVPAYAAAPAVVGSAVVGHQVHTQVSYAPKVVSQPLHIVKPATYQISSGASIPATGKVIVSAPILAKPALLAAPVLAAPVLSHGYAAHAGPALGHY